MTHKLFFKYIIYFPFNIFRQGILTAIEIANEQQINGLKEYAEEMLLDVKNGLIHEESVCHILNRCQTFKQSDSVRRACVSFYLYNPSKKFLALYYFACEI